MGRPLPIERGGVYVTLGFFGADTEGKRFLPSGNRSQNSQIFMERVKILFDTQNAARSNIAPGRVVYLFYISGWRSP